MLNINRTHKTVGLDKKLKTTPQAKVNKPSQSAEEEKIDDSQEFTGAKKNKNENKLTDKKRPKTKSQSVAEETETTETYDKSGKSVKTTKLDLTV